MKRLLFVFVLLIAFPHVSIASFADTYGHPYEEGINYVQRRGLVNGVDNENFYPDSYLSRAELSKIVVLATNLEISEGQNCFTDVTTEWFAPYVCTAKEKGIVSGYPDATFRPYNTVTYAEALKIILNAYNVPVAEISSGEWYEKYLNYASQNDLSISDNMLPGWILTRGQMAEIIYWVESSLLLNKSLEPEDDRSDTIDSPPEEKDTSPQYICSRNYYNCSDFNSHTSAQKTYKFCMQEGYGDVHDLDRDHDGLACESLM